MGFFPRYVLSAAVSVSLKSGTLTLQAFLSLSGRIEAFPAAVKTALRPSTDPTSFITAFSASMQAVRVFISESDFSFTEQKASKEQPFSSQAGS